MSAELLDTNPQGWPNHGTAPASLLEDTGLRPTLPSLVDLSPENLRKMGQVVRGEYPMPDPAVTDLIPVAPISPLLSNVTLAEFKTDLLEELRQMVREELDLATAVARAEGKQ